MGKKSQALAEAAKNGKDKPRFLSVFARILIILLVLAVGAGSAVFFYARYTKTHYTITFYQETSKKLSQSIRLAVIPTFITGNMGKVMQS